MCVVSILLAILATVCIPFVWWYLSIRKYKSLEKLPGPKPLPLLGNAHSLGSTPQALLRNLHRMCKEYNGMFRLFVGKDIRIVFAKPHLMENIMSSNVHLAKSDQYNLTKPWLGEGLITSAGTKWRGRRKMITPTFHFKILEQFLDTFNSASDVFIEILSKNTDKTVDLSSFVNLLTLDIICETAMGIKVNTQRNEHTDYVKAVEGFLNITMARFFSAWQRFDPLFYFSPKYKSYKKCLSVLHGFTNQVIEKRRREIAERKLISSVDDVGIKRKVALLDLLLEAEVTNNLSTEDIREEIDTFMFAGHDTTSSAISFALLALADNPEVQQRLYDEIVATIGTDATNTYISSTQIHEMKYLDIVLKEVQRYYSVVPFIERRLEQDCCIDGQAYPAGINLMLFIFGLHRSEEYFPNPDKFDPDRFLPENIAKRSNFAYVPFSAGPRNCIGFKFATLEMKCTVAKVVRNFKLLAIPNYKPDLGLRGVLTAVNGICVQLERR